MAVMTRLSFHVPKTFAERAADAVADGMGSWRFIGIQTLLVVAWMALNLIGFVEHWDPYPFILLNLLFSTQAAYAAPIIMMSQNRQAAKDREMAKQDDVEIGMLLRLQQEQMRSHKWQIEKLCLLLEKAGHPVSQEELRDVLPEERAGNAQVLPSETSLVANETRAT